MQDPGVHARGEAASSCLPPERATTHCRTSRDEGTAAKGSFAAPASKPFCSEQTPFEIGRERRPNTRSFEEQAHERMRRLAVAISAGDRSALRQLHIDYLTPLVAFFSRLMTTCDADAIDEAIAETMFRVWGASSALSAQISIHAAIMRIAYLCVAERVPIDGPLSRPQSRASVPSSTDSNCPDRASGAPETLLQALGTLPLVERAVVHLVYSGHSRQEVANILGMPAESLDTVLASSRTALHPWLSRHCMPSA